MIRTRLLLAEDEVALGMIIKDLLESRGFDVFLITRGDEVYRTYLKIKPDLLILDVMMPNESGLDIAKKIRQHDKDTPILFLTARTMPDDVLNGFEAGGNDYLKKPFDMEELVVRIRVLLNHNRLLEKADPENQLEIVQIGEYRYDLKRLILTHPERTRKLTSREGELLNTLYQFKNRMLNRKDLLIQVWGDDDFFSSRSLDVYISKLRGYFKADPMVQIINHRGFGYKLIC
ncbi:response regulator transcription factor [Pedobacter metabolipauper]|uniref:DNA-binding response OmpR family regulator n=1 Tax=Pedobacter metabolipauper TaxID=425513 RepID=A0A4R6SWN1_9SPHI|nr:response regulator transcription factor [Pedobacter metabolipauper]TDQ08789.1 DNA-binding response OmpR family regulator [Pedobacter metabolipauper]